MIEARFPYKRLQGFEMDFGFARISGNECGAQCGLREEAADPLDDLAWIAPERAAHGSQDFRMCVLQGDVEAIPVFVLIHSSLVSILSVRSKFEILLSPRHSPVPRIFIPFI